MPIHERDPWREQYFEHVACPADVHVPTDDIDAFRWNPAHRWVYNKLLVAESQGLECGLHGLEPATFPVFAKPVYNLCGMAVDSCRIEDRAAFARTLRPGQMWMVLLEGEHVSTDAAVVDGRVRWIRHTAGRALHGGMFDYWTVESRRRAPLDAYCQAWIERHLAGYTGMVNLESIGGRIIECHLRFTDQWPDLYGPGWLDAVVRLYADRHWAYDDNRAVPGYSVVLFGPHGAAYRHPPPELLRAARDEPRLRSVQVTFDEGRAPETHTMPAGGFRLLILNTLELGAGLEWRRRFARHFGVTTPGEAYPSLA
ncbi:MAG: hypothetical protein JSR73_04925 [Proteobacteria bacterium]|nr:hypothetical protein [Pseudomonadota bacterium]